MNTTKRTVAATIFPMILVGALGALFAQAGEQSTPESMAATATQGRGATTPKGRTRSK